MEKKKTYSQLFNISEVIISTELSGRIDTSNWINQANIVTPDFKKSQQALFSVKSQKFGDFSKPTDINNA